MDDAGCLAAGAAGPLVGGGARGADGHQRGQPAGGVGARLPRQPGVDHDAHPRDGQRALGHCRGDDDAASTGRGQRAVLLLAGLPAVEGKDLGGAGEPGRHASDLGLAGDEDEYVPVVVVDCVPGHRGDVVEKGRVDAGVGAQRRGEGRRVPLDPDVVQHPLGGHHGDVAERAGQRRGVRRRRGRDQGEVVA